MDNPTPAAKVSSAVGDGSAARFARVMEVFGRAVEVSGAEREAVLAGVDADIAAEVRGMLEAEGMGAVMTGVGGAVAWGEDGAVNVELPRIAGHYRIIREIGRGGMGVVYLAEQTVPRRMVALKAVHPGLVSRQVLGRFVREAHILGRLQHPGIAQVFEAGEGDAGAGYIVMEYVEGLPLVEWMEKKGLGMRERMELVAKVCDAVQHAHQRRVVHRDLKPANVLVTEAGEPKVLDFGIARLDAESGVAQATHVGTVLGTPAYMAPEQVRGGEVDARADVYALGVLLFEALTWALPHDLTGKSALEAIAAVVSGPGRRASALRPELKGDVEAILMKATARDAGERYQSADALAADIRRYLAGEPITARSEPVGATLRRVARRHKALVGLGAAAVLVLAGAAVVFAVLSEKNAKLAAQAKADGQRIGEQAEALRRTVYASRIGHASASLAGGDPGTALHELEECEAELRGWEWRVLMRGIDRSVGVVRPGMASGAVFTPDGASAVGLSSDGRLVVSGTEGPAPGAAVGKRHEGLGTTMELSGSPDGKRLLHRNAQGVLTVIDTATGEESAKFAITERAKGERPTPPGTHRAVWLDDRTVLTRDRARLTRITLGEGGKATYKRLLEAGPETRALCAADGGRLALEVLGDESVVVRDAASGAIVEKMPSAGLAAGFRPVSVYAAPDGRRVVVGSFTGAVAVWDRGEGGVGGSVLMVPGTHRGRVLFFALSADGTRLVSCGDDRQIRTWSLPAAGHEGEAVLLSTQWVRAGEVQRLGFSEGEKRVVVSAKTETETAVARFETEPEAAAPTIGAARSSLWFLSPVRGGTEVLLSALEGEAARISTSPPYTKTPVVMNVPRLRHLAATKDGGMVWTTDRGEVGFVTAAGERREIAGLGTGDGSSTVLAMSENQQFAAALCFKRRAVYVLDLAGRRVRASWNMGTGVTPLWLAVGNEGQVAVSDGAEVRVYAGGSGTTGEEGLPALTAPPEPLAVFTAPDKGKGVVCMAFSPENGGDHLAVATPDSTDQKGFVSVFAWRSGRLVTRIPKVATRISTLVFVDSLGSDANRRLAGGGFDGLIHVWAMDGRELAALADGEGQSSWISLLGVLPDGTTLLAGDGLGKVRLWRGGKLQVESSK